MPVGAAGTLADASIETIDAVDTEALQFSATDNSQAAALESTNTDLQRLSIKMKDQLVALIALTVSTAAV